MSVILYVGDISNLPIYPLISVVVGTHEWRLTRVRSLYLVHCYLNIADQSKNTRYTFVTIQTRSLNPWPSDYKSTWAMQVGVCTESPSRETASFPNLVMDYKKKWSSGKKNSSCVTFIQKNWLLCIHWLKGTDNACRHSRTWNNWL